MEGHTYDEIAESLGIDRKTAIRRMKKYGSLTNWHFNFLHCVYGCNWVVAAMFFSLESLQTTLGVILGSLSFYMMVNTSLFRSVLGASW